MSRFWNAFAKVLAPLLGLGLGTLLFGLFGSIVVAMFYFADRSGEFGPIWFLDDGRVVLQHEPDVRFWHPWTLRWVEVTLADGYVTNEYIATSRLPIRAEAHRRAVFVQTGPTEIVRLPFTELGAAVDLSSNLQANEATRHGVTLGQTIEAGALLGTKVDQTFLLGVDGSLRRFDSWIMPRPHRPSWEHRHKIETSSQVKIDSRQSLKASDALLRSPNFVHDASGGPLSLPMIDAWLVMGTDPSVRAERDQAIFVALDRHGESQWRMPAVAIYGATKLKWSGSIAGLELLPIAAQLIGEELWLAMRARSFSRTDEGVSVTSELKLVALNPNTGARLGEIPQSSLLATKVPSVER